MNQSKHIVKQIGLRNLYRFLIIGGSGLGKTNALLNLENIND